VILVATTGVVSTALLSPDDVPWMVAPAVASVLGALIATRVPGNVIGRLMIAFGASTLLSGISLVWLDDLSADAAGWTDAIANAVNTAGVQVLPLIMLRFPDGRPAGPRWRWAEWLVIGAMVTGATAALLNGGWGGDSLQALAPSPLRLATAPWGDIMANVFYFFMVAGMGAGAASLFFRYRRAGGEQRHQLKWLVYAAALLVTALLAVNVNPSTGWEVWAVGSGFALIPIGIGVAVLRYRLYDIDLVINRTVLFALLAAFITIVYATMTVALSNIGPFGSSIAATAVIAVAFEPVRQRAQRWADRVAYGKRASPYEVLSDLTQRLATTESAQGLLDRTARRLADGTGAERAGVWVAGGGIFRLAGTWPAGVGTVTVDKFDELPGTAVPIESDGELLGALTVEKRRGDTSTPTEARLIHDLAGSSASVLRNLGLQSELESRADELASSRRRLVDVQDFERRRLERDLDEGAQQLVVSLKVKLNVAARLARMEGVEPLAVMLEAMDQEAREAITQIRSLARGLYPQILEAEGLAAAVRSIAEFAPVPVEVDSVDIGRLSPELEATVFFCISEAITNAAKHAPGRQVFVKLGRSNGDLIFSVQDQGAGFDQKTVKAGSGLRNMADRLDAAGGLLEIDSAPGRGTRISGRVPLVDRSLLEVG
jgi:signal transduction histidine kinase